MKDRAFRYRVGAITGAIAIATTIALTVYVTRPGIVSAANAASPTAIARYDGETLFTGLYFGEGPVAKMFPEVWGAPQVAEQVSQAQNTASWRETKTQAMEWVRTNDPNFFNRFQQDIQSGDHVRVSLAYQQGSQKISEFVRSTGVDPTSPEARAGVGLLLVLAVAVWVWVYQYSYTYTPKQPIEKAGSETAGLQQDALVNMITERLAHS